MKAAAHIRRLDKAGRALWLEGIASWLCFEAGKSKEVKLKKKKTRPDHVKVWGKEVHIEVISIVILIVISKQVKKQ